MFYFPCGGNTLEWCLCFWLLSLSSLTGRSISSAISAGAALAVTSAVIDAGGQTTRIDNGKEYYPYTIKKRPTVDWLFYPFHCCFFARKALIGPLGHSFCLAVSSFKMFNVLWAFVSVLMLWIWISLLLFLSFHHERQISIWILVVLDYAHISWKSCEVALNIFLQNAFVVNG